MSYDVSFYTKNEARKNILMSKYEKGSWQYDFAQKYGSFFDLCGWCWSKFINELRAEIGHKDPESEDNTSFFVQVKDLRKIANAIEAFENTSGAQKYKMYIELFDAVIFFTYDPDVPFPTEIRDENPNSCWLTIEQVYEMKKVLCSAGNFMESFWEVIQYQGIWPSDLPIIIKKLFADAPDDELVSVVESY